MRAGGGLEVDLERELTCDGQQFGCTVGFGPEECNGAGIRLIAKICGLEAGLCKWDQQLVVAVLNNDANEVDDYAMGVD